MPAGGHSTLSEPESGRWHPAVLDVVEAVDELAYSNSVLFHQSLSRTKGNGRYFLLIGTEHDPSDTVCTMFVELEGDGVTMDACCNHTLIPGESAELEVVGGDPVYGYTWTPAFYLSDPETAVTTVTPAETISYQVDGVIGDCQVSSSVYVAQVEGDASVPNLAGVGVGG